MRRSLNGEVGRQGGIVVVCLSLHGCSFLSRSHSLGSLYLSLARRTLFFPSPLPLSHTVGKGELLLFVSHSVVLFGSLYLSLSLSTCRSASLSLLGFSPLIVSHYLSLIIFPILTVNCHDRM